ncbi:hypothetical protein ACQEU3_19765 [Spirillospora sp. CA-253888]
MKGRLRKLRAHGREFRWKAEVRHVPARCIRLSVWGAGKNSRMLRADLLSKSGPGPWGPGTTDQAYPTPADVRAVVDYGLAHGWEVEAVGGTFVLAGREHAAGLALADFVLTDRLQEP